MKKLQAKKKWVADYNNAFTLANDLEVLLEFRKEGDITEEEVASQYNRALSAIEKLEFRNMLSEAMT